MLSPRQSQEHFNLISITIILQKILQPDIYTSNSSKPAPDSKNFCFRKINLKFFFKNTTDALSLNINRDREVAQFEYPWVQTHG